MTAALRAMQWPDLADVARIDQEVFGRDAWSQRSWWAELAGRPRRHYLVAVDDEQIVGYAGVDLAGATADVMTIAVAPGARTHNTGARLLTHLTTTARRAGAEALLLEVRADNHAALHLYRRAGFEHIRTRKGYYRPDDCDALIMRAHLHGGTR